MKSVDFGILVLGYCRANSIKKTILSLERLSSKFCAKIYVHIDGAYGKRKELSAENALVKKTVIDLYNKGVVHNYTFREKNLGTLNSVFCAVTDILNSHENILVFEDDLELIDELDIPLPQIFLSLTGNISAFSLYSNKTYNSKPFLSQRFSSQGWGTSKAFWKNFDPISMRSNLALSIDMSSLGSEAGKDMPQAWRKFLAGNIDSWAIPWNVHNFMNGYFMIYTARSFVINNSHLNGAQRTGGIVFDYELATSNLQPFDLLDLKINKSYLNHFTMLARIKRRFSKLVIQS